MSAVGEEVSDPFRDNVVVLMSVGVKEVQNFALQGVPASAMGMAFV